jgi:uncharacterized membrane protein
LHWSARLSAWQRQGAALAPALLVGVAAAGLLHGSGETPWLAGWVIYCAIHLGLVWKLVARLDATGTRRRAQWIDPGSAMLFGLVTAAACASVVAVTLAVHTGHSLQGWPRWGHLALAVLALAGSWLLIQTAFALHYARVYYRPPPNDAEPARGLAFPGGMEPDYLDFLYFATVVGMTSQVSDVAVPSRRMRRLTLVHGLLSFGFNLVVLAMAVNVFASSLS